MGGLRKNGGYIGFDTLNYEPKGVHSLKSQALRNQEGTWREPCGLRGYVSGGSENSTVRNTPAGARAGDLLVMARLGKADLLYVPSGWAFRQFLSNGEVQLCTKTAIGPSESVNLDGSDFGEQFWLIAAFANCTYDGSSAAFGTGGVNPVPSHTFSGSQSWGLFLHASARTSSSTPPTYGNLGWDILGSYSTSRGYRAALLVVNNPVFAGAGSGDVLGDNNATWAFISPLYSPNPGPGASAFPTVNPN